VPLVAVVGFAETGSYSWAILGEAVLLAVGCGAARLLHSRAARPLTVIA
jgi:hypothetical protein